MVWSLQSLPTLSDAEFERWGTVLEERAGIFLSDQQRVFLQTQVAMRMRELDFDSYSEYLDFLLEGISGKLEWSLLIDRLVVKETSFFRHKESLDFVASHVSEKLTADADNCSVDVWSVGCSSGEEPYSLAMVLNDAYEWNNRKPTFGISATDISRVALSVAKSGIYSKRKLDRLNDSYRNRYFDSLGDDRFQVVKPLRERMCFSQSNILNINDMPVVSVDVIYCQNLLIYFKKQLREKIINAFAERLKPGGILVIGTGEVVDWTHPKVRRVANSDVQAYEHI